MITATDKRTPTASISTGTPVKPDQGDTVLVQPTTHFLEGSRHVGPHSEPYPMARHHAMELVENGFATIVEPKPAPLSPADPVELPSEEDEEPEVDLPDDASRAPNAEQTTASTVPTLPGAEPARPAGGPVPPAATSEPPRAARRGRPPGRRG